MSRYRCTLQLPRSQNFGGSKRTCFSLPVSVFLILTGLCWKECDRLIMITKRLYVGGLSHNISKKDLKDRFGKFGEVSDVEVVTRKDEDGKCMST